jgi:hypothetical protein
LPYVKTDQRQRCFHDGSRWHRRHAQDWPQKHISKIEGGADLQLSALIELARLLDLEVAQVPKRLIPAAMSLARQMRNPAMDAKNNPEDERRPMYALDPDEEAENRCVTLPWHQRARRTS